MDRRILSWTSRAARSGLGAGSHRSTWGPDDEGGFWDGGWRRFGKRKDIWEGDEFCRGKNGTESDLERNRILGGRILGVGEYLGAEEELGRKNMWDGRIHSAEEYLGRERI